jgi:cell division protease FtsH
MITQYGMSEKFGLMGLASVENRYLDGRPVMNCGDATATEIDHEVMKVLKESYEEALRLLRAHRDTMDQLAEYLIARETITGKEFMRIFRDVEGIPDPVPGASKHRIEENAYEAALPGEEVPKIEAEEPEMPETPEAPSYRMEDVYPEKKEE